MTPNYDKIFDTHVNHVQHNSVLVKNYYDADLAEAIRSTDRLILKIHGTIDSPHQVVLTRTDYAKARNDHRQFYTILNALAITHTFLFLGCGLSDPDIRLLLEDYGFGNAVCAPHFFVLPRKAVHNCVHPVIERTLNLKLLTYDSRNDHALLTNAIDELAQQVALVRTEIQTGASW